MTHLATAQQLYRDMLRDGWGEHSDALHYLRAAVLAMEREAREAATIRKYATVREGVK